MARNIRMLVQGEAATYHIVSRTVLDGFVIDEGDKDYMIGLIRWISTVFFVEVYGFCIMGNHFHLLLKMDKPGKCTEAQLKRRIALFFQEDGKVLTKDRLVFLREKFGNLSELVKEIKQRFSRNYNKVHKRRGFFWSDRYKSVLVEQGTALVNCLAYIDMNPIRAEIVKKPEDYKWSSIGYHTLNKDKPNFLSTKFGLKKCTEMNEEERFTHYKEYLYEKSGMVMGKGALKRDIIGSKKRIENRELTLMERLRFKTRYFTDSGIIGNKEFVLRHFKKLKSPGMNKDKKPKRIAGFDEIYSLKRLSNDN